MNEEIKIEKDIPIPSRKYSMYRGLLLELKVGDSFLGDLKMVTAMRSIIKRSNYKIKLSGRNLPDGTYRIWRIE